MAAQPRGVLSCTAATRSGVLAKSMTVWDRCTRLRAVVPAGRADQLRHLLRDDRRVFVGQLRERREADLFEPRDDARAHALEREQPAAFFSGKAAAYATDSRASRLAWRINRSSVGSASSQAACQPNSSIHQASSVRGVIGIVVGAGMDEAVAVFMAVSAAVRH